jgi:hypothetical protein
MLPRAGRLLESRARSMKFTGMNCFNPADGLLLARPGCCSFLTFTAGPFVALSWPFRNSAIYSGVTESPLVFTNSFGQNALA